jgi:pyridoxine kinase
MESLQRAIRVLHKKYKVPHVVITSVSLEAPDHPPSHLSVVGSSMTSDGEARLFKIVFPAIDCYFSGTGDMFAALMVVRMREAIYNSNATREKASWVSDDSIAAVDLPLAQAAEKVLASMHEILTATASTMPAVVDQVKAELPSTSEDEGQKKLHLITSKAAELRLARNLSCILSPAVHFRARGL